MQRISNVIFLFIVCVGYSQPLKLDTSFTPQMDFFEPYDHINTGYVSKIIEEESGKIVAIGEFHDWPDESLGAAVRFLHNGTLDNSWQFRGGYIRFTILHQFTAEYILGNDGGFYYTNSIGDILTPPPYIPKDFFFCGGLAKPYFFNNGSFLMGMMGCNWQDSLGNWNSMNFARVDSSGWVDFSFDHNTDDFVETVDRYDSARFMVYGRWVSLYDSIPTHQMFRIYEDGTLDTTFQLDPLIEFSGRPLHIQEDGKIIVGRAHMHLAGRSDTTILLRLHQNGSIDSSFNTQSASAIRNFGRSGVYAVCPTTDGGYLVGGQFEKYDGYPRGNIVKTDPDGFVDTQYFTGTGIDSTNDHWGFPETVFNIIPGQNDTYYVMGDFLMFDGQPVKPIIRLLGLSHTVGLEKEVDSIQVSVFPNPAHNAITFEWDQAPSRLIISDTEGRVVEEKEFRFRAASWIWDASEYPRGMYFYLMKDSDGLVVARGKVMLD